MKLLNCFLASIIVIMLSLQPILSRGNPDDRDYVTDSIASPLYDQNDPYALDPDSATQAAAESIIWSPTGLIGELLGQKTYDIYYNKDAPVSVDLLCLQIMKEYTPYGKKFYTNMGTISPTVAFTYICMIVNVKDGTYRTTNKVDVFNDNQLYYYPCYNSDFIWQKPEPNTEMYQFIELAKNINNPQK